MNKQEKLIADTKPCPNEEKYFEIGKLFISMQIASDYWANSKGDAFRRSLFSLDLLTMSNSTWIQLIIHKLKFNFAILPKENND